MRTAFTEEHWSVKAAEAGHRNVLLMGGGLGMGSIKDSLLLLDRLDCIDSFSVVTGHNADLFDDLSQLQKDLKHDVKIFGYTNQIAALMAQASLLVTKPGALTCTEAAAVGVPSVFYSPIPGQEEANASYMQEKGCARWVKSQSRLVEAVSELLQHTERLGHMSQACRFCRRDGAEVVSRGVLQMLEERKQKIYYPSGMTPESIS